MAAKDKTTKVGKVVLAYCGTCKTNTKHKVKLVKQGKIVQVTCTVCKATHAYRAPQAKKVAAPSAAVQIGKIRRTSAHAPKDWATLISEIDKKSAVNYKLSGDYSNVVALNHKVYGIGIITKVISPEKIEVVFKKKTTILAQNYK